MSAKAQEPSESTVVPFTVRDFLLYFLRLNAGSNPLKTQSATRFLWSLDPLGLSLFVGAITCCLIALEVRGHDDSA